MKIIDKKNIGQEKKQHFEELARNALLNGDYIPESYKVEFLRLCIYSSGLFAELTVFGYKPRSRKPDIIWTLFMDIAHEEVDFSRSHFAYLK